jgi:lysophospholipase L1-like esterase
MLNAAGEPMPQIFIADSLHMNAKGYAIWQKAIIPYLVK